MNANLRESLVDELTHDDGTFPDAQAYGMSLYDIVAESELPEAPIPSGQLKQFLLNGRTLAFEMSPTQNEGVAWITKDPSSSTPDDGNKAKNDEPPVQPEEEKIYPVSIAGLDYTEEYRDFVRESYSALREILNVRFDNSVDIRFSPAVAGIVEHYADAIKKHSSNSQQLIDANNVIRCFLATSFQADNRNRIAKPFMDFVNYANVNPATEELADIMSSESPITHPLFWKCMTGLVLRNLLDLVAQSLEAVSDSVKDSNAELTIQQIVVLLKNYDSESEPYIFRSWKENVQQALQNAGLIKDVLLRQNLSGLLQILSGDKTAILAVSTSWFEAIAAFFCYIDPTKLRMEEYYETAVEQLPVDVTVAWEEGCAAVMNRQYLLAIEKIESLDPFAATVICESCDAKGLMNNYITETFNEVRSWLLTNFAKQCIADEGLQTVGIELLLLIRTDEAKEIFVEFIPRFFCKSFDDLSFAIEAATAFELPETVRTIHRIAARRFEFEGNYVEALTHWELSRDTKSLVHVAWKLFEKVLISGIPSDNELLVDAVNNRLDNELTPAVRNVLAPYAVLARAFNFLEDNKTTDAARHVAALFKFPYMPIKYYGLLFLLSSRLLDREQPRAFNSSEIVLLMQALDKWESPNNTADRDAGLKLLKECVTRQADQELANKFKRDFEQGTIFSELRIQLAKEVSRAYSEGF